MINELTTFYIHVWHRVSDLMELERQKNLTHNSHFIDDFYVSVLLIASTDTIDVTSEVNTFFENQPEDPLTLALNGVFGSFRGWFYLKQSTIKTLITYMYNDGYFN